MKNIRRLIVVSLVFLSIPLASCQRNSIYGVYAFEMGSKKGTHFGISLTLGEGVSSPKQQYSLDSETTSRFSSELAEDAVITQHPFEFTFENVAASTSSSSSGETSLVTSTSSLAISSSSAGSSASSSSAPSMGSSSSTSASTSEESSSEEDSGTSNLKIKAKGLWSFYTDSPVASSSAVDTSNGNPLRIEFTYFEQTDVATGVTTGAPLYLPANLTKAVFDISLKGKVAAIKIPVSATDLMYKVLAVLGGASPSELDSIHQVTIELTKQD